MNVKRLKVAVLFGGKSLEHDVSISSARTISKALEAAGHDVLPVKIETSGTWRLADRQELLLPPAASDGQSTSSSRELSAQREDLLGPIDVVFPALHGTFGEDGAIQGWFKTIGVPFVGTDVLGSAVCMDKDFTKRLLREAGIPTPRHTSFTTEVPTFQEVAAQLGTPMFVKPANSGSSIGISKATSEAEYNAAVAAARKVDRKVIIEEAVIGREIEVAVLGNDDPKASLPGEIVSHSDFYTFEAKYDEKGAQLHAPAKLSEAESNEVRRLAVLAFKALSCEGLARVDFFLTRDGRFLVNEINTLPGFTQTSMYPLLWRITGLPTEQLVQKLLELALERHPVAG